MTLPTSRLRQLERQLGRLVPPDDADTQAQRQVHTALLTLFGCTAHELRRRDITHWRMAEQVLWLVQTQAPADIIASALADWQQRIAMWPEERPFVTAFARWWATVDTAIWASDPLWRWTYQPSAAEKHAVLDCMRQAVCHTYCDGRETWETWSEAEWTRAVQEWLWWRAYQQRPWPAGATESAILTSLGLAAMALFAEWREVVKRSHWHPDPIRWPMGHAMFLQPHRDTWEAYQSAELSRRWGAGMRTYLEENQDVTHTRNV